MAACAAACSAAVILAGSATAHADDFSFEVEAPDFRVIIPGVPAMKMAVHPEHDGKPHYRFLGSESPYSVAIFTPKSDPGMSVSDCAEAMYDSVAARPGVPEPDKIYRARINDTTFIAIYATLLPGFVLLHAHLLSAGEGDHCIEVHASKSSTSREEASAWFTALAGAKIEPR
jgi:hypothetical protein